jgi:hypothetical protein
VVLADGPKVFRGDVGSAHRPSDFESVDRSRLVSKSDRKLLLAMMKPQVGPAKEAGRYAGTSEKPAPQASADVQARNDVRVVYPSALR